MKDETVYTYGQICRILSDALPTVKETEQADMFYLPVLTATTMHTRAVQCRALDAKQVEMLGQLFWKIDPTDVSFDRISTEQVGQFILGYHQDPSTVGTKQAAEMLGVSVARVKQLIDSGDLKASLTKGVLAISVQSIKAEIHRREK
ncbi:MAG: helix-turn-helix domain-containing protein [Raoultibacter sp.]